MLHVGQMPAEQLRDLLGCVVAFGWILCQETLDNLAEHLEMHMNLDQLLKLAGEV